MRVWNVREHGAAGDGSANDAAAINRTIERCATEGGGRVLVPAGTYLVSPIHLRSNVDLHLARGATIVATKDRTQYPLVETDYEGESAVRCISPIWGVDLVNVSISGEGTIDGKGEAWRPVKKWKMTEEQWSELLASGGAVDEERQIWWPSAEGRAGGAIVSKLSAKPGKPELKEYAPARDFLRPNMVKLTRCRNVVLDGPTFRNSAAWNVHLLMCDNVTVRNVTILNPWFSTNGDALDIDSCCNVTVVDSHFDAGDDAICIKSGKDEAGRKRGKACENITVSNCTVVHGHGGVTIGSEMSGDVRNVRVFNCVFKGTDIGLRFKTTRGRGGVVENVEISNITMYDIRHEAIGMNMYYFAKNPQPEPVTERTPRFRDFVFRNITCHGATRAVEIRGLPEMPIETVRLENIRMSAKTGILLSDARGIVLDGVRVDVTDGPALECHNVRNLRTDQLEGAGPMAPVTGHLGDL